jgi:predicted lipase
MSQASTLMCKFMCAAIRTKAREIKSVTTLNPKLNGKIPLYVTGHSLGAALASLFYTRLRKGGDLDDVCDLCDAYVYGCPAVGDTDFAMGYTRSFFLQMFANTSNSSIPYNTSQTLWRVINDYDLVTRVPFSPCTLFNGGVGEGNHMLMETGMVKVYPDKCC